MLNHGYRGYKSEKGLLKILRPLAMKPDVIMLFPVTPFNDGEYFTQVDGCQFVEMPTVQLRKLMPGYENCSTAFHWITEEVWTELKINRGEIEGIFIKIFTRNGIDVKGMNGQGLRITHPAL